MKIIAGPCQHESLEQSLEIAKHCELVCKKYGIEYFFKASFDKANRTSSLGKRGLGIEKTMHDFDVLRSHMLELNIVTDVHETWQVEFVKDYVDVIQIPAFLCRQTDLIRAAVETGKIVNIKKGQFLAPWDVKGILSKTEGAKEVWLTERGTSFGYNTLVVDYTGIQYIMDNYDVPFVFDATHSVQKPGGLGNSSGGNRSFVPGLCRAASAMGVANFFLEVHPDPDGSPSDGANMLYLNDFEEVVEQIVNFHYVRK